MKKLLLFATLLFGLQFSFASLPTVNDDGAASKETKKTMQRAAMEEFSKMTVAQYEQIRGKKMNFFERMSFKMSQKKAKHMLKKADAESEGFNIGGFALGFLLGLLGVLIAYLASHDSNLHKWSWIGLGASVVLSLIIFLLVI